jgi:hypothetical protein
MLLALQDGWKLRFVNSVVVWTQTRCALYAARRMNERKRERLKRYPDRRSNSTSRRLPTPCRRESNRDSYCGHEELRFKASQASSRRIVFFRAKRSCLRTRGGIPAGPEMNPIPVRPDRLHCGEIERPSHECVLPEIAMRDGICTRTPTPAGQKTAHRSWLGVSMKGSLVTSIGGTGRVSTNTFWVGRVARWH